MPLARTFSWYVTAAILAAALLGQASPAAAQNAGQDDVRDAHRVLQWTTAGSLLLTGTLGTLVAMNKPTLFGEGRCAKGGPEPIFGEYGCEGLSVVHGLSAILSTVLYTATVTTEFAAFDWPGRNDHGTGYKVASAVHLAGMGVLPIVGIVAAVPMVLGMEMDEAGWFQRIMRTLHLSFGYVTVGTYMATAAIEL